MAAERKKDIETVRKAIYACYGIKTDIARRLKVVRQTLDNYLTEWPELLHDLKQAKEGLLDEAETALAKRVKKGDTRAIIFALETLGRDRGYQKRTEITGANGRPVLELSPELSMLMAEIGVSGSDIIRTLTEELRAARAAS